MNVQADPNKIEELSQQFKRWRRELESSYVQMVNVANRTAGSARSSFSEDGGVRSAAHQVERLAQEIQHEARELAGRLEEQSRLLYQAAGEYRQLEREAERKLQSAESSRLPTELKRFISQGVHAGSGALAPMSAQMLPAMKQLYRIMDQTSFVRKLMDMLLSKQVAVVQADPMVAEWLRVLSEGTPKEKEAARLKLSTIAMSLTAIKEAQREYSVYHYFGRSGYMDEAHVRANEAREKLRALGVDDTYYNEQVKLAGTNLLDSLEACRYNPLKDDGSPMPEQAELLAYIQQVIAKGQVDPLDALQYQLLEEKLRKIESGELPPTHLPDGTLIDENNKWNETTFAYFETYIKHEGMEAPLTHYDSWVKETYGRTKWEGFVKTSGEVTMGFTKGLLAGIIEGIVDTAGLAYQLVVDPQQVGQDMLYAAEYLIQNRELVVEAAKQMYANFESASPEEKAEMIGKVSSILVPGMGVTKAGKAAKVPEALSSMTQAVKTSKAMNVLANPIKKFKAIDWKSYTIRFQDWVQSLKPGRYAITPEGMLVRIPDETSSVVRRIDAGDSKKIEGTGQGLKVPQGLTQAQFDKVSSMIREKVGHISDDIVVQGSRAKGTAKPTSDIDIAIRVPAEKFNELIQSSFSKVKPPNPGSAKEKTMLHAIETGKIQSGEAKLSKFREQLQQELGMDVDISIIKMGGPFDNPPFTPLK
ncbi:nucleotidyltransferase domain-containing protein [Paenibacillus aquistagni]|uniref:nucleotidyltransferase domain-containing protein n=1 Tax=Paenibacillus aquistagni TaxID=1852522 RepID=UPI00197EF751